MPSIAGICRGSPVRRDELHACFSFSCTKALSTEPTRGLERRSRAELRQEEAPLAFASFASLSGNLAEDFAALATVCDYKCGLLKQHSRPQTQ